MADRARDLESQALDLPPDERARLAARLLASLEGIAEPEAETLWLAEAERRLAELESGATVSAPADEAFRKSRSALR
jgi:putative addiction module component (TIGR02574 family)